MSAVGAWIMSILGIVVIGTVFDLILPQSKMSKFMKSVFATLTVLVIVLPLPGFFKNGFDFNSDDLFKTEFTLDESYINSANEIKINYMEYGVKKQLESDGYKNAEVEITGTFNNNDITIQYVKVNIKNLVIDSNLQHINKYEQISDLVTKYLNVDKGVVIIYG